MQKNLLMTSVAAAALVTVLAGIIYVSVQQSYRTGADDPQIQLAREFNQKVNRMGLNAWTPPRDTIDIAKSLAPFMVLYDPNGVPLFSDGVLDGKMPVLPAGVLAVAQKKEVHRISWQPRRGVRMAMVIESTGLKDIAFVASGRSLKEVEHRVANLTGMIFAGWLVCLGIILLHYLASAAMGRNRVLSIKL